MTDIYMAWGDTESVRKLTDLDETDATDAEIQDFISMAQKEINSKLINRIVREKVQRIDAFRENEQGVDSTYYVQNWHGKYLADSNFDNEINTSDIKVVQYDTNTKLETELTVSSIDITNCSFTLSSVPSQNVTLYVDYAYMSVDPVTPNGFLALATNYLASSYALIGEDDENIRFGNVSIGPSSEGSKGDQLYNKYLSLLQQLTELSTGGSVVSGMDERI
jgi:hypothetical protein